jgi:1-acyl-sn-glycerol-3-phosphate acyltransferase
MAVIVILVLVWVGAYLCIRARILPVPVMRAWFAVVMVSVLSATNVLTLAGHSLRHLGVSTKTTKLICTAVCIVTFRLALFLNPHIRIRIDERQQKWSEIPEPSATAVNHTSFWDAFCFVGSAPVSYIYNCKTLMKATLRNMPLFGPVYDRIGHFPVYFKTSADGDFSVDKERQAVVAEAVNAHIKDSGRIAFFPEGAVNKTPRTLNPFRHGSFATILQNKLKVYYFVSAGNEETWPPSASLGGYPADIDVVLGSFELNHNDASITAKDVAERLQAKMQSDLEALLATRAARGRKSPRGTLLSPTKSS